MANRPTAPNATHRRGTLVRLVVMAFLVAACATAGGLAPGGGRTFVVEGKSYDEVWNAARSAMLRHLTALVESDKSTGRLTAEQKASLYTWGEVVGVFISGGCAESPLCMPWRS